MNSSNVNRRDLIRTVGASSLIATGVAQGFRREELGTVRIIEAGLEFDLPDRNDYHKVHLDERNQYYAHPETREINVFKVPAMAEKALKESGVVVNGDEMTVAKPPTIITNTEPSRILPTGLGSNFRRTRGVILKTPLQQEPLVAQLSGQRVKIESEQFTKTHPLGDYQTYQLRPRRMEVETTSVTDERVERDDIPENQRSLKTEYSSVRVEATPTLHVRDRGEMTVVKLEAMG